MHSLFQRRKSKAYTLSLRVFVIFAGLLLVHEAVLGPGGLDPVTGALVVGEGALQLEVCDPRLVDAPQILDCVNNFVESLYVMLKFVLEQELLDGPFGHRRCEG